MKKEVEWLSKETGLEPEVIKKVYKAYWQTVKDFAEEVPLKEAAEGKVDFKSLRPNINIPSLGKLNCTEERFNRINKRLEHIKALRNNENSKH
jgi:hypothetical protein